MSSTSSIQFSSNSVSAIKSIVFLKIKCPQIGKPKTTVARNQNSITDINGEKIPWWGAVLLLQIAVNVVSLKKTVSLLTMKYKTTAERKDFVSLQKMACVLSQTICKDEKKKTSVWLESF